MAVSNTDKNDCILKMSAFHVNL